MQLSRSEAEIMYVEMIMSKGNPPYFIYKVIADWDDSLMEEKLEEMALQTDADEIEFLIVDDHGVHPQRAIEREAYDENQEFP